MNYTYDLPYREVIHGYQLETPLTTQNAGMSRWAYAVKNGREYFLKQFLSPKYPALDGKLSPELVMRMRRIADQFYEEKKRFYDRLGEIRIGNVIVVQEFFREGSFYYITSERVRGPYLSVHEVSSLSMEKKRVLLKSVLYSMSQIHERMIVHGDLKPDNILIRQTSAGYCTAKIIDFEASFFAGEAPEEVEGDQVYFSPEAVLLNNGESARIDQKADVFALGVLFHQYLTGRLPGFDTGAYSYLSEAVLDGASIYLDPGIEPDLRRMLIRMLDRDPEKRPGTHELWQAMSAADPAGETRNPGAKNPAGWERPAAGGFRGWYAASDDDL